MAENGVGGRALEWAMRLFGYGDDFGLHRRMRPRSHAGSDGVQFAPWLLGSVAPARTTMSAPRSRVSPCSMIAAISCAR
jgi:sugar (pentulose or hexulose) kinase